MANFSQRDPIWAKQRLGTCDGVTIGSDGCFVTAFANIASHFGKDTDPARLDDYFTNNGLYVDGCLCTDGMLTQVYPDIQYVESFHFENSPADFSVLVNSFEDEYVIEVDADPNAPGVQTHFSRFYDYYNGVLRIIDSWTGQLVSVADVYGDPAVAVQKIVHYRGSSPTPTTPPPTPPVVDPAPVIPPAHPDASAPSPDPTPAPQPTPEPPESPKPEPDPKPTPTPVQPKSQERKISVLEKLKSRKLWVALLSAGLLALHGEVNQAVAVLVAYLTGQAAVDAFGSK